jgi:hypothetical protein
MSIKKNVATKNNCSDLITKFNGHILNIISNVAADCKKRSNVTAKRKEKKVN